MVQRHLIGVARRPTRQPAPIAAAATSKRPAACCYATSPRSPAIPTTTGTKNTIPKNTIPKTTGTTTTGTGTTGITEPAGPPPKIAPAPEPTGVAPYKFLGKNGKKISILVQSPGIPFLPDDQLAFLTKILEACRMNIGDVAIINTATAPVNINTLKQQLQPGVLLLFGLEPTAIKLPINFPEFKVQPYDNCSYLSAPPLTRLVQQSEESKLLKGKLWVCLKTLFNV